jgi:methylamine utilization protein MauE
VLSVALSLVLALVLLVSAGMKLASGPGGRAALATYGIRGEPLAGATWAALGAIEAGLSFCLLAGVEGAAWATALLFTVFCVAQGVVLVQGRAGAPCACFGTKGRVSRASLGRAALLAVAAAVLPWLDRRPLTTDEWLGLGLAVALAGVAVLAVALLALAREIGELRLQIAPQGALEIAGEGPEIGGRTALAEHFAALGPDDFGLAVFTSEGCHICQALAPSIAAFERDPRVVVRRFDEVEDADAWALADVPGSPFAVAVGADGIVLAKGTFNSGGQLESVLAAAERRRGTISA